MPDQAGVTRIRAIPWPSEGKGRKFESCRVRQLIDEHRTRLDLASPLPGRGDPRGDRRERQVGQRDVGGVVG